MDKGGWYVVTVMPSAIQYVNGGPYKSKRDAFAAIHEGLLVRRGGTVEIVQWSAADVEKYKAMVRFPKARPRPRCRKPW